MSSGNLLVLFFVLVFLSGLFATIEIALFSVARARARRLAQEKGAVGFYFARLWYFEELYPKIFAVAALNQIKRLLNLLASPGVASPS